MKQLARTNSAFPEISGLPVGVPQAATSFAPVTTRQPFTEPKPHPDSMASHTKFRKKYDLALPLASDEAKHTLNAYGVWTQKSMYGRKYMGVERTTFLIKEGKIARIWRKVSVPGHAQEVLEAAKRI